MKDLRVEVDKVTGIAVLTCDGAPLDELAAIDDGDRWSFPLPDVRTLINAGQSVAEKDFGYLSRETLDGVDRLMRLVADGALLTDQASDNAASEFLGGSLRRVSAEDAREAIGRTPMYSERIVRRLADEGHLLRFFSSDDPSQKTLTVAAASMLVATRSAPTSLVESQCTPRLSSWDASAGQAQIVLSVGELDRVARGAVGDGQSCRVDELLAVLGAVDSRSSKTHRRHLSSMVDRGLLVERRSARKRGATTWFSSPPKNF